jgi:hypothetical protein
MDSIDAYREPRIKAAQCIEPGSVQEISASGEERKALILVTMRIALDSGATMVTMARSLLSLLDENKQSKEERDAPFLLAPEGRPLVSPGPGTARVSTVDGRWIRQQLSLTALTKRLCSGGSTMPRPTLLPHPGKEREPGSNKNRNASV